MSSRVMSALIFLGVLSAILMLQEFIIGLLQMIFDNNELRFDIFGGVIKFARICIEVIFSSVNLLSAAFGFIFTIVSIEELTGYFNTFTGALAKMGDYIIHLVVTFVGADVVKKMIEGTKQSSLFSPKIGDW